MMKRTGPRLGPDDPSPMAPQNPSQIQQAGASNMHTLAQTAQPQILSSGAMVSVGGGFGRGSGRAGTTPLINYLKPAAMQYAPKTHHHTPQRLKTLPPQQPNLTALPTNLGRQSPAPSPMPTMAPNVGVGVGPGPQPPPGTQFQRLKVEDALSYLDQVKYKFNAQPQVYNDFLDIMKEFKSQTIDTPGVITRVSNLFKGHPELIVGFNTFLPPGYKIEVQSNGQVSVSMPSPSGSGGGVVVGVPQPQLVHLVPHHLPHQHQHHQPLAHQQHQHQQHHAANTQAITSAVVHNLSVSAAPTNTLHQISQAHQQIEAAAIHHATPGSQQTTAHSTPAPASQPVEFNHAIEYVNKIKSRFSRQPDKYKRFLEILHAYQRGHREMKEPQSKQQTEQEVYSQVAKLFENQDDLLAEFGQFLPDAKAVSKPPDRHPLARSPPLPVHQQSTRADSDVERRSSPPHAHAHALLHAPLPKHTTSSTSTAPPPQPQHHHLKRSPSFSSTSQIGSGAPAAKKSRVWSARRDVSLADAAKLATVHEFNFFDRARKALRSHHVYDNFLRCLLLFTNEIISSSELLCVTAPFLCRHPELQKWLQDFLGPPSPPHTPTNSIHTGYNPTREREREREQSGACERADKRYEPIGALGAQLRHERPQGDAAMDIDLTTCKRLGTSYCALPRDAAARKCSGRTPLCKEVLNDTWVSFPTWSEDSTFVTSRKTQYEEYIYRCEDERFELDVVIETNASTIRVLEGVQKKLSRMTPDDAAKFRLDDCLGGHSPTIHQRALRRIYGDKAVDIIAGLKKNPVVAVPVVLRRLKAKEEEWREAQKGFNKQWREQNEKYYLKSLDHQGINFKQNDLKAMRSKSLFNEVEAAFAAHRPGPHVVIDYNMQSRQEAIKILRDTAELLIHHARRQTAIQKQEKRRIKQLLRHFIPDLFSHPRQPLSDDDDEEKEEAASPGSPSQDQTQNDKESSAVKDEKQESSESDNASDKSGKNNKNKENKPKNNNNTENKDLTANSVKRSSSNDESVKSEIKLEPNDLEDDYRDYPPNENRFVCTSSWYLFLRAHGLLCSRLAAARRRCGAPHGDRAAGGAAGGAGAAHALRLARSAPQKHYDALLDLVRALLDGNVDAPAYEDAAREMLGIEAYPAYTLDKLVSIAVRQLQHCVTEPRSTRAVELARGGAGGGAYVRRAARLLRREHSAFLVRVAAGERAQVAIELLAREPEHRTWPTDNPSPILPPKPVFLLRNARGRAPVLPHNTHSQPLRARAHQQHARRKQLRPLDDTAMLAVIPLHLYRRGALATARSTLAVNAKRRRDRFRAWLRDRH